MSSAEVRALRSEVESLRSTVGALRLTVADLSERVATVDRSEPAVVAARSRLTEAAPALEAAGFEWPDFSDGD